jgi:tripartite-type tricarboxylate transporter receptor subunit TctC
MTHVPFKGSGPATLELLAGRVDVFVATVPTILSHVQDGKLSVLAVTSATRSKLLPDVPTMKQAGIEGYEVNTWWGLLAPADTPTAIIDQLHAVVLSSAASPLIRERLIREGAEPLQMSPAEFAQTLGREIERWRQMARQLQGLGS